MHKFLNKKTSILKVIALSYIALIAVGAICLSIPQATKGGISYIDALFTSASATCVTGLIVFDTYVKFTLFGQLVILFLIQIGGIGFMTVATLFLMITGNKIGLWGRGALKESINAFHIGGVVRLVKRIILVTFVFEGAGAILLAIRFCQSFGMGMGIYFAIFHSISAFCNAGFDLLGKVSAYSSLNYFQGDVLVNLIITLLILTGGLGFVVWDDIFENKFKISKYKLHSKIVIFATAFIIVFGTAGFYLFENVKVLSEKGFFKKILISFFLSTTPRTAGFSALDINTLSGGSIFLTIILMFIGASPGSTGGGIKTTTMAVILISAFSYLRHKPDESVFKRRLEKDALKIALSGLIVYFLFITMGVFAVLLSQNLPLGTVVFEVVSAIGTVGLSFGITAQLNVFSKL